MLLFGEFVRVASQGLRRTHELAMVRREVSGYSNGFGSHMGLGLETPFARGAS